MKSLTQRPLARSERVLVEDVGNETVIYDLDTSVAHALKPLAASVFAYADGSNTPAEIAELASYRLDETVSEKQVLAALAELEQLSLLDKANAPGVSRRDALKVFAAASAGTMLVTSVAAPAAFAGTSQNGYPYVCAKYSGPLTGNTNYGYPAVDWPQANQTVGTAGGPTKQGESYDLSQPCYVTPPTDACYYNGKPVAGVTASECQGFCYDTSNGTKCYKSSSQCGGQSSYKWVTGTWKSTGGQTGTWQCVPCDGLVSKSRNGTVSGYQCCEVVCVPDGTTVPGAVTGQSSGNTSICTNPANCPGYGSYTTRPYWGIGYTNKFCTTNSNCNPGNCS